jgi:hypothetical protein
LTAKSEAAAPPSAMTTKRSAFNRADCGTVDVDAE